MFRTTTATCLMGLVAGFVSVPYSAKGAQWGMSGLECVQANVVGSPDIVFGGGTADNAHETSNMGVRCPIKKNIGGADVALVLSVNDQHTAEGVSCYVRSCGFNLSCEVSDTYVSTSTGIKTLGNELIDFSVTGNVYVYCDLPDVQNGNRSGVVAYSWND